MSDKMVYFKTHEQEFALALKNILSSVGSVVYEVIGAPTERARYLNAKAKFRFLKRLVWETDRKFFGKE